MTVSNTLLMQSTVAAGLVVRILGSSNNVWQQQSTCAQSACEQPASCIAGTKHVPGRLNQGHVTHDQELSSSVLMKQVRCAVSQLWASTRSVVASFGALCCCLEVQ